MDHFSRLSISGAENNNFSRQGVDNENEQDEEDLLFSRLNIREDDTGNGLEDDEIRDITMDYALGDNDDDDLYLKDTFSNVIGTDKTFYDNNPSYFHNNNHQISTLMTQNMNMRSNTIQDDDTSMSETVNDSTMNDIDNGDSRLHKVTSSKIDSNALINSFSDLLKPTQLGINIASRNTNDKNPSDEVLEEAVDLITGDINDVDKKKLEQVIGISNENELNKSANVADDYHEREDGDDEKDVEKIEANGSLVIHNPESNIIRNRNNIDSQPRSTFIQNNYFHNNNNSNNNDTKIDYNYPNNYPNTQLQQELNENYNALYYDNKDSYNDKYNNQEINLPNLLNFKVYDSISKIPYIITSYLQLLINLIFMVYPIYIGFHFLHEINNDINKRTLIELNDIKYNQKKCQILYDNNNCNNLNYYPALIEDCNKWENCINQEPILIIRRSKIIAETIGAIINSLINEIKFKNSLSLIFIIFLGYFMNISFGYIRTKFYFKEFKSDQQGQQQQLRNHLQQPQESMQQRPERLQIQPEYEHKSLKVL
ncbi:unnamed protein product [[Candida] boidinii]|nr:unnamed protein product [[Candida] boidinii]